MRLYRTLEDTAHGTELAQFLMHVVAGRGQGLSTQIETEHPVDSARGTARIISRRRQSEAAFLYDRASVRVIRFRELRHVDRSHVERHERGLNRRLLGGIFHDY